MNSPDTFPQFRQAMRTDPKLDALFRLSVSFAVQRKKINNTDIVNELASEFSKLLKAKFHDKVSPCELVLFGISVMLTGLDEVKDFVATHPIQGDKNE